MSLVVPNRCVCVCMVALSGAPALASTVAFNTFGPGDSYNSGISYLLLPQESGSFGFVFEANATGRVEEITLAVRGDGNFRAELFTVDDGSLPEVSPASWSGIAATTLLGYANQPRITPNDGPVLQAGSSYAIVIHSESPNTLGWFFARAIGSYKLPLVEFDAQGNWMATTLDAGAFRIIVPTPSALLAIGLGGLLARRRRVG